MRVLALMLASCAPTPRGHDSVPTPAIIEVPDGCDGLRVVERLPLGGAVTAVAHRDDLTWATTAGWLWTYRGAASVGPPLPIPGEPYDLQLHGTDLWIAAGTGGVLRVSLEREPRVVEQWKPGGQWVALAAAMGKLWAADNSGRVLAMPLDAKPGDPPRTQVVDGWPRSLAPWAGGVLVALGTGGLIAARAEPDIVLDTAPAAAPQAQRVATGPRTAWWTEGRDVVRWRDGQVARHTLAGAATSLVAIGDTLWIATGRAELWSWPADRAEPVQDGAELGAFAVNAIVDAGAGRWVAALGDRGMARVGGSAVELGTGPRGEIEALVPTEGGVLGALGWGGDGGELLELREQASGDGLRIARRFPLEMRPSDVAARGETALVAGVETLALRLSDGQRTPVLDRSWNLTSIEATADGWIGADANRGIVLIELDETGIPRAAGEWPWLVQAEWPDVFATGDWAGAALGGRGGLVLRRLSVPDAPAEFIGLDAGLRDSRWHADYARPARSTAIDGVIWTALPTLGVQGIRPRTHSSLLLGLPQGAVDVRPQGDLLVVAMGTAGVGLVDPNRPEAPLVARCDLPGYVRHVAPLGGSIVAASGGTLYVLEPVAD